MICHLTAMSQDYISLIHEYLNNQKDFSGFVMIGEKGKITYAHGFGYADRIAQRPFTRETLSTIGSITKPFTATAILLLLEDGKLALDQTIGHFFPHVPADKKNITIHHLLTHTAGFPGAIGDDYASVNDKEFQALAWDTPLLFPPGTSYEYSNAGYSILGMIIEKLSDKSYSDFLEERIFQKAGMKTAGYTNPDANYQNLAHGYLQDGTDWGTSRDKVWDGTEPYWHLKANGGLLMSPEDMFNWYLALRNHTILQPETLTLQITPHADEGRGSFYGYGYAVDGESVQHNGSNRIFKADFRWNPEKDLFFYSMTNDEKVRLFRINDEIIQIYKTGKLPEKIIWQLVEKSQLMQKAEGKALTAFIDLLHSYTREEASVFIESYCTAGTVERNGEERLLEIFELLSNDTRQQNPLLFKSSGQNIQIVYPADGPDAVLKISLFFLDSRVDKLNAEIGGS